jgi:RimJ/RimL family protein N-acetyltransferase
MDIYTKRLFIRPFKPEDVVDIYDLRNDSEVMRFIREPQSFSEVESWVKMISSKWETEKIGIAGVFCLETKELIGWCGLWILPESGETEVGYAIKQKYWRKGYASEAATEVLNYGFNKLNLDKIVAVARLENIGSINVMKKIGMEFIKIGNFYGRELVQYGIKKEEYDRNREIDNA